MPLSIAPFPNWHPIGPHPPLHGPVVSPIKVVLEYLGPSWLPLIPCSTVALSFQLVPSNEQADSLAKTRATLPSTHVPSLQAPVIAKIRQTTKRRNLSHNSLFCQISSVYSEKLALTRLTRCKLSRLSCHGHSFSCPLTCAE